MEKKMSWLLVLVSAMWGSSFVASKVCINGGMREMEIVFIRFAMGALFMGVVFHKEIRRMTKSAVRTGLILGVIGACTFSLEMYGLAMTEASKASFLTASNIVMMPFLYTLICKVPLRKWSIVAACITMVGIGFLTLQNGVGGISLGDVLLLLDAVTYCMSNIMVFKLCGEDSRLQITFVRFVTVAVFMGIFAAIQGFGGTYSGGTWLAMVYLILVPTVLCFTMQTIAMKYVNPMRSALIFSTESIFCTIFSALLLHEKVNGGMLIGMVLVIFGILTEILHPEKKPDYDVGDIAAREAIESKSE